MFWISYRFKQRNGYFFYFSKTCNTDREKINGQISFIVLEFQSALLNPHISSFMGFWYPKYLRQTVFDFRLSVCMYTKKKKILPNIAYPELSNCYNASLILLHFSLFCFLFVLFWLESCCYACLPYNVFYHFRKVLCIYS